jgi:S-formylglutathione hydrolase FrmB
MKIGERAALRFRLAVCILIAIFAVIGNLRAQFNDERRRGDLTPISLPGGGLVDFKSMESRDLGTSQPYSIFLPPSYNRDQARKYPVIYFLHGLNNDHTSWTVDRYGNIQNKVEEMMVAGKIPEFIMVHPRADNSFYCNYADGTRKYENFVVEELPAYIESHYRIRSGREDRAIAGTSMGGYGALKIAMKFPGRYAAVAAHSPIIFVGRNPLDVPDSVKGSRYYQFFVSILTPLFGDPVRQDLWDANNPLLLAKTAALKNLAIYFDYGTDDRYIPSIHLDEGVKALDAALTGAGVPHTFTIEQGEPHGWALVASHLSDSLPFLCRTFK